MRPRRFCRGKHVVAEGIAVPVPVASMRPRRFCRGKLRDRTSRPIAASRGFNEAPAILPGKAEPKARLVTVDLNASMRPRRFCRGKPSAERTAAAEFSLLQ